MKRVEQVSGGIKKCTNCEKLLPLGDFGRHRKMAGGLQSTCRLCKRAADKRYAKKNKSRKAAYDRLRRQQETQIDRDDNNARRRELYRSDPEVRRKRGISNAKWKKNNPEKAKMYTRNRRARKANAGGNLTVQDWEMVKSMFHYRCAYCGDDGPLSMDHIIPLSKNGEHSAKNIVPSCISCNSIKSNTQSFPVITDKVYVIQFYYDTFTTVAEMHKRGDIDSIGIDYANPKRKKGIHKVLTKR